MEKKYLVTGFNPHTAVYADLRTMINERGWSCFPFEVIQVDTDPQEKPICKIPNAPGCGTFSLFYFTYQ